MGASFEVDLELCDRVEALTFGLDVKQKDGISSMTFVSDGKVRPDNQSYRNELVGLEPRSRSAMGSAQFGRKLHCARMM